MLHIKVFAKRDGLKYDKYHFPRDFLSHQTNSVCLFIFNFIACASCKERMWFLRELGANLVVCAPKQGREGTGGHTHTLPHHQIQS